MMPDNNLPLVSVIMNCFNGERYLREAIDSVYSQTYPNWEIIFWDNASTDSSGEIANSYDNRMRYFRGEETTSLGEARNKAMEQARGEFIAFLDCDDLWFPEKLEKQVPLFHDPKVGIVFCDTIYFNDNGEGERLYSRRKYCTGSCFAKLLIDNFISIPSVVIRRDALIEQKEWFDLRFSMNEECDLFIRISFNWHLDMVAEPLAKWRLHPASLTSRQKAGFAAEYEAMLVKYQKIFPEFITRFAGEIRSLNMVIAFIRARDAWESGDSRAVRLHMAPYMFANLKALTYYVMTFFPRGFATAFINRWRAIRIGPAADR
jgi:glycosyltransferase involved in cell wall biosynthesis